MSSKFEVFISHDSSDETLALLLKKLVEEVFLNAEVFVSSRDLRGGNLWVEEIKKRLSSAKIIVSLVTRFSEHNPWVLFESGTGFTEDKTIPICADGITLENLEVPLKLLHARNFDDAGLKYLIHDIANIAQLRQPTTCNGLDAILSEANTFIKLRNIEDAPFPKSENSTAPYKIDSSELAKKQPILEEKDAEVKQRIEVVQTRFKNLLKNGFRPCKETMEFLKT